MDLDRFLVVLDGPSCAGKSSVADALQSRLPNSFNARRDAIKWLISDYASGRYGAVLQHMMRDLTRIALGNGMSVVLEGRKDDGLERLAREHDVRLLLVNISAPEEVLRERFERRKAEKRKGARIANIDPERFERLRQEYERTKASAHLEFDSAAVSPEGIADAIIARLRSPL